MPGLDVARTFGGHQQLAVERIVLELKKRLSLSAHSAARAIALARVCHSSLA